MYSGSARLISFEINLISKKISWPEPKYMKIHPQINTLDSPLISENGVLQWVKYGFFISKALL